MAILDSTAGGVNVPDEEATMQFYAADGKRVSEGSASADVQYLSNDPARPDAKATAKAEPEPEAKAVDTRPNKARDTAENK